MFCTNCGTQLAEGSLFCTSCGTKLEIPVQQTPFQPQNVVYPVSKPPLTPEQAAKRKKAGIAAAVVAGLLAAAGLAYYAITTNIKPTIDLNDYLIVTFDGYDTLGTASADFDYAGFEADYGESLNKIRQKNPVPRDEDSYLDYLMEGLEETSASDSFLDHCVGGSLDRKEGLQNGDIVTYAWDCDDEYALEQYGYKLKYEDMPITVAGLEEVKTFDPFEGVIDVVFEGISPNGHLNITFREGASRTAELSYSADRTSDLENGDTVTVTAYIPYEDTIDYCIRNYGAIPSPLTKTYTVSGLGSYVRSLADISEESRKQMQSQAEDVYYAYAAQNWADSAKLQSFTYLGEYLLTGKGNDLRRDNMLYLVYQAKVKNKYVNEDQKYNRTNTVYWYIVYYDLMKDAEGKTVVDTTDYRTPDDRFTVDSGISTGWWSTATWTYSGYQTIEELYKVAVTSNMEYYNHEDAVTVVEEPEEEAPDETELSEEEASDEPLTDENPETEGMIFPDSADKVLEESEIKELSDEELRYAINEIYARHGYIFKDDALRTYYEQFAWYTGEIEADQFSTSLFNKTENENIKKMQKERDSRG